MTLNFVPAFVFSFALALFASPPASVAGDYDDVIKARVIEGWQLRDGRRVAALELQLAKGWKTYWRAPGDAGIPPLFDWRRSRNMADVRITWPQPRVFHDAGLRSIGYKDRVVIPLHITPKATGKPVRLRGQLDMGICADICMPHQLNFDATLSVTTPTPDPKIAAALASAPYSATEAGVRRATCQVLPSATGLGIKVRVNMPPAGGREETVIEAGNPEVWVSTPKTARQGNTLTATADMVHVSGTAFALSRPAIRITVLGKNYSVDIRGCTAS